jgi:CRISPR-associated endonuclease Csn1
MKKILGLDLGTTSIGWAYVKEAENPDEKSGIIRLGVRVVPLTTDEETDFQKGKSITINADRRLKRGMRRNLDRYQMRRAALIESLKKHKFLSDSTILNEEGKETTFHTFEIRARAPHEKVSKEGLARILLMINKKRGYKSSRKAVTDDEGNAIDSIHIAKELYEKDLTPGQYVFQLLSKNKKLVPDFYRSDLQSELNKIWNFQKQFYPEILSDKLKEDIKNRNKTQTWAILKEPFNIVGIKRTTKGLEQKKENYLWRVKALSEKLGLEELAIVLQEINNDIYKSSGYLGAISDRSKILLINHLTVGEYLYSQLKKNPHTRLKNQVFYRQDYLDEFNRIWEKQKEYHPELTEELKKEIRDIIIFYQRRLKSQKGLLSYCEFESWTTEFKDETTGKIKTRTIGHKVIPKSSPLFQEFKIWQIINNLEIKDASARIVYKNDAIDIELKQELFSELNIREKLSSQEVLRILVDNPKNYELNYPNGIEGNKTNAAFYKAYQEILEMEGYGIRWKNKSAREKNEELQAVFNELGINTKILEFNSDIEGNQFDKQPIMQLWHLLYSFEGDNSRTGIDKLIAALEQKFGFQPEHAKIIAKINFKNDYGNLSSKAIRKILPYLKAGQKYDIACAHAGYNHSFSQTKEDIKNKVLKNRLELLPKNSLRNPVVEKILNQMVNVVNAIFEDEELGKPDEIRVELARELKKSAKEREEMTKSINRNTARNQEIRKILEIDFGITKVTRNDILRYKLWEELKGNGYKTLYTNTYIPREKIFSKEFDIEHILPKALIFDDSFSNKTLTVRQVNIEKGNQTAYDFLKEKLSEEEFSQYEARIEKLFREGIISKAKFNKLRMKSDDIPDGFIERDLRNSQYIAKKAIQMLNEVVRNVYSTTGSITDKLRDDWQLVNVMKEINLPKYEKLGLVEMIEGKNGQPEKRIKDWTKRNDHRHHAMDALTVAFTKPVFVQYLNYMNARYDEKHKLHKNILGIEKNYMHRTKNNKLVFNAPIPVDKFRSEAKKHLESILVSFKAKNKVVTRNKNRITTKKGPMVQVTFTPRGQLHKETVYGQKMRYVIKFEKVGSSFDEQKIQLVAKKDYREALLKRLKEFEGNPKKAFTGKNSPAKNPIFVNDIQDNGDKNQVPEKVKLVWLEKYYTIRKEVSPSLSIDKIVDSRVKNILKQRLANFGGDAKKAFSNLEENPIWLVKPKNKSEWKNPDKPERHELGIPIKRVTISGVSNAIPLHDKKDHFGKNILDENGNKIPVDFVSTGNNHHVAIYRDEKGNLQEEVVSFFEAVARKNAGLPVIWKEHPEHPQWEFLFTMKQNEYFVFPDKDFDPSEIDLLNPDNAAKISPHLFRVQKYSKLLYGNSVIREYVFRHHLEAQLIDNKKTKDITFIVAKSLSKLNGIIKVRINHLGRIVHVGEY